MPVSSTMNALLVFFSLLSYISICFATVYCPLKETPNTKLEVTRNKNYYECPGLHPKHYIECCNDNRCCSQHFTRIYEIDQK
jgi:hypothetical protein